MRDDLGDPLVIRNDPVLRDGTPMPTLFWLVGRSVRRDVDRLEADGGVRRATSEVDPEAIRQAHERYAAERDSGLPSTWHGPRPVGGVGGTRIGIKCLHAHYAWFLAGGDDPVGRWVEEQLTGPATDSADRPVLAAAIDCGTNSTRLLVGYPGGESLARYNTITRLGQGVDRTRELDPGAIERTLDALRRYKEVIDAHGAQRVRMTATSAARDARNRDVFFSGAEAIVGTAPELLSGDEEGRLSFAGATADLDPSTAPWLILDIGGGSTELVWGPAADGGPSAVRSLDVGCVRLTERFLRSDPPTETEMHDARAFVTSMLEDAIEREPTFARPAALVGLAGTVSCLAGIDLSLDQYDHDALHHHVLTLDRVEEILAQLAALDAAGRRKVKGVEEARADVIVGGALVLSEAMRRLGFQRCLTSESDILDGLVASTAASV